MAYRWIEAWFAKRSGKAMGRPLSQNALSCILVVLACTGGYYLGGFAAAGLTKRPLQPTLESVNGLAIDSASLDLGEVWETPNHPLTLQVKNISGEVRSIIDFSGSCGCLKVEPTRLTISPGQTAELSLTLDLTHSPALSTGAGPVAGIGQVESCFPRRFRFHPRVGAKKHYSQSR